MVEGGSQCAVLFVDYDETQMTPFGDLIPIEGLPLGAQHPSTTSPSAGALGEVSTRDYQDCILIPRVFAGLVLFFGHTHTRARSH